VIPALGSGGGFSLARVLFTPVLHACTAKDSEQGVSFWTFSCFAQQTVYLVFHSRAVLLVGNKPLLPC
jgi:hypothetical protein